ncbi:RNA-binding domain-containing protein [Desulfurococcus mucosus]|uniref:UPF0201 protein Desmu_0586 n=1 Tax=Desulfurococcus mucosus (strain ATCC 35584 / DSM 2162 / JCM 9187 / O7/1) TaxID=765177 RepID=E8R8R9_DESM0|nr:RNA-binding domain-containing protein [Desulfurococcus mucosus]ADV64895.1 protein of unknown function DUF54 [Desulfurococcus mucosus DSM 2162]
MVRVVVEAEVRPTEDSEKVKKAVGNVFAGDVVISDQGGGYRLARGVSLTIESLKPLRELARVQQVEPALRSYIHRHRENRAITILLHKQAAYVGKLSLVDSEKESPLGAIRITVEGDEAELDEASRYLTGSS